jgi:hypothetical protein
MDEPLRRLSAADLAATSLPPRQTILDPIVTSKTIALLYGPRGVGKTFVALGIAWAAATGESFLGWRASRPHRVVYVDGEMAAVDIQQRMAGFGPPPANLEFILADLNDGQPLDLAHRDSQRRLMRSWGNPEFAVFDNSATLVGTRRGNPDRLHELQGMQVYLRQVGVASLMVHHANKKGYQRGTSRREDVVDLVMAMRRPAGWSAGDATSFEIHYEKARSLHGRAIRPIAARLEQDLEQDQGRAHWHWTTLDQPRVEQAADLLAQGLSVPELGAVLGVSRAEAYRLSAQAKRLRPPAAPQAESRP